jgi:hypothetical protein
MKKLLLITITIFLFATNVNAQSTKNPYFNYKGKLIIIGGGSIPDSLFEFFAAHCGGKDQPVVYIPTATSDESLPPGVLQICRLFIQEIKQRQMRQKILR